MLEETVSEPFAPFVRYLVQPPHLLCTHLGREGVEQQSGEGTFVFVLCLFCVYVLWLFCVCFVFIAFLPKKDKGDS